MKDLQLRKEYTVLSIDKSKFGYECTAVDKDDAELTKKGYLKTNQLKQVHIRFYANKMFNDFIPSNGVVQCYVKLTNLLTYKDQGESYTVPEFEVAIV